MMRVARKKRLPRPPRRYAQQVFSNDSTLSYSWISRLFNNYCSLVFFLFATFFSTHSLAAGCFDTRPASAFKNGDYMIYFCNPGWQHKLPENECRYPVACPDLPPDETPNCMAGYEPVLHESFGGGFACFRPCPSGETRVFYDDVPQNSCEPPPCEVWQERSENGNCVPLECHDIDKELVIHSSYPYRSCAYKCPLGKERNFNKYGDYNCHKIPVVCNADEIEVDGVCQKINKPEPVCDPKSKWYFLCQWHQEFKEFVSAFTDYFVQLLDMKEQQHAENQEFQKKVLERLAASSPVGETGGDTNSNTKMLMEKQIAQDKQFYDDSRDFYSWAKEQKEEEQNPDPDKNKPIVEDKDYQVDQQERVNWSATCPISSSQANISLMGETATTLGFDYSELCLMAQKMRPLILLAGAFISMLIIAGGLRK
ncbi:hypothetical protein F889_02920 [Acinetobacter colistiniresistens]|uniref:Uncharacterized protein n=1 Tax=Acinetobacter colistiniresistens TaxID=280145 RepID=N9QW08_9GAMM|nr:virulence factor TspB C-terminal domain-related protein [Acinetobacter colistiniresistens]ENX34256.1 hypothetical protein F889_02920 [Acinetobacter colistiniresistens]